VARLIVVSPRYSSAEERRDTDREEKPREALQCSMLPVEVSCTSPSCQRTRYGNSAIPGSRLIDMCCQFDLYLANGAVQLGQRSMTPSIFGSGGFVEREVERGFVCAYRAMRRDRLFDEIQPVRLDRAFRGSCPNSCRASRRRRRLAR
jgi:hypothetical protein